MNDEQREQSRLAIATFIVATTIAAFQIDSSGKPDDTLGVGEALLALLFLGLLVSSVFAFLFIMSKAAELRYTRSTYKSINLLIRLKSSLYTAAVTSYIPVVGILGILLFIAMSVQYQERHDPSAWVFTAVCITYLVYKFIRAYISDRRKAQIRKQNVRNSKAESRE